jgi:[ribosomal protein S18]-alanine N-acetyltransferase
MTADDLDAVVALERRSASAPHWDRSGYEAALYQKPLQKKESNASFVAQQDDAVVGFVVARMVVDVCELESIVVARELRRQGVGAALLRATLAWAQEQTARRVELEVRAGNCPAIALYERAGFVRDGLRRSYYRNPEEDAVLMGMPLDSSAKTVEKIP